MENEEEEEDDLVWPSVFLWEQSNPVPVEFQLPLVSKTNAIHVGQTSVLLPPIYSIPTSSVPAADLFHLEVHPLPSI